ncbi:MAG: hypothetical protein ACLS7P_12160 [Blautia sp.]
MAVLKSKRGQSSMEFVETARKLEAKILSLCIRSPKRMTFFLTSEIMRLASQVHNEARSANNIYPRNKHEAQLRRDHLTESNNALMNLVPKLGLLYDALILDPHTQEWCDGAISEIASIIASEKTLLRATKKADADRYRSLPTGDLQFLVDDDLTDSD